MARTASVPQGGTSAVFPNVGTASSPTQPSDALTVAQVATMLSCSPTTVRRMMAQGRLRFARIGSDPRILRSDVLALFDPAQDTKKRRLPRRSS